MSVDGAFFYGLAELEVIHQSLIVDASEHKIDMVA